MPSTRSDAQRTRSRTVAAMEPNRRFGCRFRTEALPRTSPSARPLLISSSARFATDVAPFVSTVANTVYRGRCRTRTGRRERYGSRSGWRGRWPGSKAAPSGRQNGVESGFGSPGGWDRSGRSVRATDVFPTSAHRCTTAGLALGCLVGASVRSLEGMHGPERHSWREARAVGRPGTARSCGLVARAHYGFRNNENQRKGGRRIPNAPWRGGFASTS